MNNIITNERFVSFALVSYDDTLNFGRNQENRKINDGHVRKLKNEWLEHTDLIPPITVNVLTNHIIDGQNRLQAYRDLIKDGKLPINTKVKVMFVEIQPEQETQAIIDANTNSKNWSIEDYIHSYVTKGVPQYVILDDFCKKHSLTSDNGKSKYRYGSAIITGKNCCTSLKNCMFTFTDEELKRAEDVHNELFNIINILKITPKGNEIEALAISWIKTRNLHSFSEWRKGFTAKKRRIKDMNKKKQSDFDNIFALVHTAIDKKNIAA